MVKAVFFDLDGVLIDSLPDMTASVNRSLALRDLPPLTPEQVVPCVGKGGRNLVYTAYLISRELARVTTPFDAASPEFDAILKEFLVIYREHAVEATTLYPGVAELLAFLKDRGIPCALISNKPYPVTLEVLETLRIGSFFDVAVDPSKVARIKPAPDSLMVALDTINEKRRAAGLAPIENSDCLMVGDSDSDIQAGKAFGAKTAAVLGGYGNREALLAQNADWVLDTAGELKALIIGEKL
jgi:phosphoglycolate phosphatase